jgi:hypothetical protein
MDCLTEDIYGNKIMRSMDKVKEEACTHGRTENKHRSFLTSLQLEYLTHKLRSVIYQNQTYASVAADIAAKKRAKIEELSAKFHVDTIFTPGYNVSEFIERNFWQPYGLPLFQYKDDEQRRVQGNYDKWYILSSFFLFCPATFLYDMDFFGEIRNMSIFGTKYRFKWQAIAFQLDIDITFAECLKTEIW